MNLLKMPLNHAAQKDCLSIPFLFVSDLLLMKSFISILFHSFLYHKKIKTIIMYWILDKFKSFLIMMLLSDRQEFETLLDEKV